MQFNDFENLLGKHISSLTKILGNDFENKLFEKNLYYIKDENISKSLNQMSFRSLIIITNQKENIESITIHFMKTINSEFYNLLTKTYGNPNEIKVIEKREEISQNLIEDEKFNQQVKKYNLELRDGTFEENPLFINWIKSNFNVKVFQKEKQKTSDLTFENKKIIV